VAAYPTLPYAESSRMTVASGHEPKRATNGTLKLRRLHNQDRATFVLAHELTDAQKTTLDAFYASNKDIALDYTWPATAATYAVKFTAAPQYVWTVWGWQVQVRLEQT
jgi:hypothetical protein